MKLDHILCIFSDEHFWGLFRGSSADVPYVSLATREEEEVAKSNALDSSYSLRQGGDVWPRIHLFVSKITQEVPVGFGWIVRGRLGLVQGG